MSVKTYEIENIGRVNISKRRNVRHLSLSVQPNGIVKVSIPYWLPYQAGVDFAQSKTDWINSKMTPKVYLYSGQQIKGAHKLLFLPDPSVTKPRARVMSKAVVVTHPPQLLVTDESVQNEALRGVIKVLRSLATDQLPKRIAEISKRHNLPYKDVTIKQLKRRWGSCDQKHSIVLNLFLIQLPDELIDYVICHELTHTLELNHGPKFWNKLEEIYPNARQIRHKLRQHTPGLIEP